MAQPTPAAAANGVSSPDGSDHSSQLSVPGKRKRDSVEEPQDEELADAPTESPAQPDTSNTWATKNPLELVKCYYEVLQSLDTDASILKRPLPETQTEDEPQVKRQKSAEPGAQSIADKFTAGSYSTIDEVAADIDAAATAALSELEAEGDTNATAKLHAFKSKAMQLYRGEKSYPLLKPEADDDQGTAFAKGTAVLSLTGMAPQERRLFSSLPADRNLDLANVALPPGITISRVTRSNNQERTMTLGELFGPQRALLPLHPPKQPKTQAKGNTLDFYRPDLSDKSKYRANSYFNTKLSAGYYLDYSNATPSSETVPKQRERAESLAGKKPSMSELEMSEVESLFRGAFSAFAPCKDDSAAVVPSNVAGRMWWQRSGQGNFERMIEVEYYDGEEDENAMEITTDPAQVDEAAIQDAIDNWDSTAVDPSLEDAMGSRKEQDRDADAILEEVSDMIETLASYQRIRNLTLPNSQNRQSSDPVKADMLTTSGPQPSEDEQATYEMLKAQLSLIIKTLPPYAVAKLNGDQLDELLISTKIQVETDDYRGVMEEDDAGVQARLRAQQQHQQQQQQHQQQHHPQAQTPQQAHHQMQQHPHQQQAAHARQQRTPSMSGQFPNQYQANAQYGTPGRTPSQQQYYRPGSAQNYQQPRGAPSPQQPRPPQPNQYTRQNGYSNQYATQLAKAQTPYGHQNMQQYANQQRPPFNQTPQQGTPNSRYQFQPGYQGTPTPVNYGGYTNGAQMPPQRQMSPQQQHMQQRQMHSQSPNMPQAQQFATPTHQNAPAQGNRFASGANASGYSQSPGLTGYHTVISEAQQQRILDQAKARVAAQGSGTPAYNAAGLAQARAALANQSTPQSPGMNGSPAPSKMTHVPMQAPAGGQQQQSPPPPPPQQQQQQ